MRILIIEDEILAQAKLEAMLQSINPGVEIGKVGSVKEAVSWLAENATPDLAFVDIQLSDDHSFEIFRKIKVEFPVIFTTAYDQYLLESFEFNSIDYLLKPITEEKLKRSLSKLNSLQRHFSRAHLQDILDQSRKKSTDRLVVKKGTEFVTLTFDEIAYFYTEHRIVFVRNFDGRQFIIDRNLSEIELSIDITRFFRINRKYIAHVKAIEKFKSDNGKIRIFLTPAVTEEVHVSKETAPEFRKWIGVDN